jgi:quinone-modifying oxidoreductase subunit QmoA
MTDKEASSGGIVVIGGGIAGVTTAVEAAEAGHDVILLEKEPFLGGRVVRLNQYFPKLCPPTCGLEINFRRIKQNPRIKVFTMAEVKAVHGEPGAYRVTVELQPRRVNDNCTACNDCVAACPIERSDAFNYGVGKTKAIYLPHQMAFPLHYVIDEQACPGESCAKCVAYCPYDAIELTQQSRTMELTAGSVVVATGWKPYDATRLENLGFGRLPDVVTNVMLERMAANNGPTKGQILRPSDGEPPQQIVFVQCAGSRDEHHLDYCSTVCCTASFKQASYIRKQYPDAEIHIFYIDIRTMGTLEDFYLKIAADDPKIFLHKGKVAKVERFESNKLVVTAEETQTGERRRMRADMVVLATGMQPAAALDGVAVDALGFIPPDARGVIGAGCAKRPVDVVTSVQDATAGALRAIQGLSGQSSRR